MAQKQFYQQNNIGRAKYTLSYHNGIDTHKDGSPFFGIKTFSNKKKLQEAKNDFFKQGYIETC